MKVGGETRQLKDMEDPVGRLGGVYEGEEEKAGLDRKQVQSPAP
jgi:hypothetical protein